MAITKNLVNIGNADISGELTAATLKKRNGTNKQILLADGTTKDMGTGTTTFLRNDGTWATPQFTAANHYTPSSQDSSFAADATGATPSWGIDVVKGVKILKDSKGHVTGLEVVSGRIPSDPVSKNTVFTTGTLTTDKLVLGAGNNKTIKSTNVGIGAANFEASPNASTIATELGVKNYINGQLTGAMHFVGLTSTTMSDGQTTNPTVSGHTTFTAGDVVIDPSETEFIYDGSTTPKWHKLGDAKSYALASNVVNNITVKGDTWITPSPTTSQKGIVTVTLSHKTQTSYSAKGSTTKVPQITTDGAGHVTTITEQNIAFPSITVTSSGSGNVISNLTSSGHKLTITKSNITVSDTKQSISASTGKVYLTGVTTTSITGVGYANASVYMQNGGLNATNLSVTTATISTLNGSSVPNNPKFSDTVYTHPSKTQSDTTSTAKPSHGGSFTVVDGVTRDGQGHVSGINVKTVTLPGSGNTDTKQTVTASNDTVFLSGVSAIGNTDVGYANASVYMINGKLYASSLTVTSLTAPNGTITNANISTLNGSTVPNDPKFTDTLYKHPTITATTSTSTATLGHGGTFTVVNSVTTNTNGHVTKINTKTFTLPASGNTDTKQSISASTGKVYLTGVTTTSITGVGYANASVYMQNGGLNATNLSVTTATISTLNGSSVPNNPKFSDTVYTHPSKTQSNTTSSASPGHGGSFTVVDGVTRDGQGHVSGINVKTVTLPGSGNTDEKVKVTKSTTNASYPLMAVTVSSPTSGATYGAIYDTGITMNPNTHLVSVSGKVNAASGFFQTSDINKKNIIGDLDLDKAYDLIDKCQTILYTLKDDDSDKEQIGLIAQEVKEFFPELITEDNDGSLSLDYSRLTVVILKVLKDIINRIKILESK